MPAYRFQTTDHDRWAIVGYVRALQRTVNVLTWKILPREQFTISRRDDFGRLIRRLMKG